MRKPPLPLPPSGENVASSPGFSYRRLSLIRPVLYRIFLEIFFQLDKSKKDFQTKIRPAKVLQGPKRSYQQNYHTCQKIQKELFGRIRKSDSEIYSEKWLGYHMSKHVNVPYIFFSHESVPPVDSRVAFSPTVWNKNF